MRSRQRAIITCAIDGASTKCWGNNFAGNLGDGTKVSSPTPVTVVGVTNATKLVAGPAHACALSNAAVACWGDNSDGRLGDGTTTPRSSPVPVALPPVAYVASGHNHVCALTDAGVVYCWGNNTNGQLGLGDRVNRTSPELVALPQAARAISAQGSVTCAQLVTGTVYCWGAGTNGELVGSVTDSDVPLAIPALAGADELAYAGSVGCMRRGGEIACWGRTGWLVPDPIDDDLPHPVVGACRY